jgi:hypothetical protein
VSAVMRSSARKREILMAGRSSAKHRSFSTQSWIPQRPPNTNTRRPHALTHPQIAKIIFTNISCRAAGSETTPSCRILPSCWEIVWSAEVPTGFPILSWVLPTSSHNHFLLFFQLFSCFVLYLFGNSIPSIHVERLNPPVRNTHAHTRVRAHVDFSLLKIRFSQQNVSGNPCGNPMGTCQLPPGKPVGTWEPPRPGGG